MQEFDKIEKNAKSVKLQTIEFGVQARKLLPKDDSIFYSKEVCDLLREIVREQNGAGL